MLDIGRRIRELRDERGMSRDELAKTSGMAVNSIYLIESGRRRTPSSESLEKLAHGLGVSISALYSEETVPLDEAPVGRGSSLEEKAAVILALSEEEFEVWLEAAEQAKLRTTAVVWHDGTKQFAGIRMLPSLTPALTPEAATYVRWLEYEASDSEKEAAERDVLDQKQDAIERLQEFDRIHGTANVMEVGPQSPPAIPGRIWAERSRLQYELIAVLEKVLLTRPRVQKVERDHYEKLAGTPA